MNNKGIAGLSVIIFLGILMMLSCRSDRKGNSALKFDDTEAEQVLEKIDQIKKVYNLFPPPAEMLSIIDVKGMQFNPDLLNPVTNVEKYLDTRSLTINLGVYSTDLAYSALFGRHEETIDILEIVQDIADKVRVTGTINKNLIDRAKNNINYIDSLFNISNEAFINMMFFCEKNDRPGTVVLISTGAFVESLFLAANMIENYDAESYMIRHIADQEFAVDNLMAFAESDAAVPNVDVAIEILKPLALQFDKFRQREEGKTVKKDESGKQREDNNNKTVLSESDFIQLKETIGKIRSEIIADVY
jgi:hypothetical protein